MFLIDSSIKNPSRLNKLPKQKSLGKGEQFAFARYISLFSANANCEKEIFDTTLNFLYTFHHIINMEDYTKLKLKAGLEIHQQLDTDKLFSHTPSLLRKDEPDYEIKRKLHAIAGESGDVDVAVACGSKSESSRSCNRVRIRYVITT